MALPQSERNGVTEVARNIAAKFLKDRPGETLSPELWGVAYDLALGARGAGAGKTGGIGSWNDMAFLIPDGLTAQQFTDRVFGFVQKNPAKGPVNPDGSPANLRIARPVAVRPGVYQFFVGNRVVLARGSDGKIVSPWQFTLAGSR